MIAWLLVPYVHRLDVLRPWRYCAMDEHTAELQAEGGDWAESEINGDRAVVRVRAHSRTIDALRLKFPLLSETEAGVAVSTPRAKPYLDALTKQIRFSPLTDQPCEPLGSMVGRVPETAPSPELLALIGLWASVGFGEGWRLPWETIVQQALSGLPPLWGAAFPTTQLIDQFNRANENPLAGNWTCPWAPGDNNLQLTTNAVKGPGYFADGFWNPSTFGPPSEAFLTWSTVDSGIAQGAYLGARQQNPGAANVSGYYIYPNGLFAAANNEWQFRRTDAGADTTLGATFTQALSSGDGIGIEIIGSTIAALHRGGSWTQLTTRSDSTYSGAGSLGMGLTGATNVFDDFGGGTVTERHQTRRVRQLAAAF